MGVEGAQALRHDPDRLAARGWRWWWADHRGRGQGRGGNAGSADIAEIAGIGGEARGIIENGLQHTLVRCTPARRAVGIASTSDAGDVGAAGVPQPCILHSNDELLTNA